MSHSGYAKNERDETKIDKLKRVQLTKILNVTYHFYNSKADEDYIRAEHEYGDYQELEEVVNIF